MTARDALPTRQHRSSPCRVADHAREGLSSADRTSEPATRRHNGRRDRSDHLHGATLPPTLAPATRNQPSDSVARRARRRASDRRAADTIPIAAPAIPRGFVQSGFNEVRPVRRAAPCRDLTEASNSPPVEVLIQGRFRKEAGLIRGLMSDAEWACFEPFVTVRGAHSGRRPKDHRLVLDGVFWIARTGAQWRDLHEHFGKWSSVYRQFRRWTLAGLWELLLEALNETEGRRRERPDDRQHHYPGASMRSRR